VLLPINASFYYAERINYYWESIIKLREIIEPLRQTANKQNSSKQTKNSKNKSIKGQTANKLAWNLTEEKLSCQFQENINQCRTNTAQTINII